MSEGQLKYTKGMTKAGKAKTCTDRERERERERERIRSNKDRLRESRRATNINKKNGRVVGSTVPPGVNTAELLVASEFGGRRGNKYDGGKFWREQIR